MLRRLRTPLLSAGGLAGAALVDRALTPKLSPLSSVSAAAGGIGSVAIFQYEICPFCCKVKAMLDLHGVPYETTDVNPLTKGEIKAWSGGYKKVPIAMLGGEQVNDSPVIVSSILDRMGSAGVLPPKELSRFRSAEALEWAKWSDEKLAVLLFPNITRSYGEALQAFGYVNNVPHFSTLDRLANQLIGSFAMWMAQGKIKKKYGIEDERAAVVGAINHWLDDGVGKREYAGGSEPNLADVAVFGALKAIDRTDAFREIMAETRVAPWYERMLARVQPGRACTSRQ